MRRAASRSDYRSSRHVKIATPIVSPPNAPVSGTSLAKPWRQQRSVRLPPALTISTLILLGLVAGTPGVLLATPLTAALVVLVKKLYLEDTLEEGSESVLRLRAFLSLESAELYGGWFHSAPRLNAFCAFPFFERKANDVVTTSTRAAQAVIDAVLTLHTKSENETRPRGSKREYAGEGLFAIHDRTPFLLIFIGAGTTLMAG